MTNNQIRRAMLVGVTIVTSFFLGAAYQNSVTSIGGKDVTVTTTATLTIPEMVNITRSSGFPIRVGDNEFKEQFVIRTNINWEVVIHNIPVGILVLDKNGQWVADSAVIAQGVPTNRTTVMVQYRRPENMVWGTESSIIVRNRH